MNHVILDHDRAARALAPANAAVVGALQYGVRHPVVARRDAIAREYAPPCN
jgi:hypothetical protein